MNIAKSFSKTSMRILEFAAAMRKLDDDQDRSNYRDSFYFCLQMIRCM
jgi:hypothetical protein